MALATLPYKWKLTTQAAAGAGSRALTIVVTDNAGNTRLTTTVHVSNTATWDDLQSVGRQCIEAAMLADAGSKLNVLNQMISAGTAFIA